MVLTATATATVIVIVIVIVIAVEVVVVVVGTERGETKAEWLAPFPSIPPSLSPSSLPAAAAREKAEKGKRIEELTHNVVQVDNSQVESSRSTDHVEKRQCIAVSIENVIPVDQEKQRIRESTDDVIQVWSLQAAPANISNYHELPVTENMENQSKRVVRTMGRRTRTTGRTRNWLSRQAHECPYCGKKLSSKSNMKKHVNAVHERTHVIPCDICGMEFYQPYYLNRHREKHHGWER